MLKKYIFPSGKPYYVGLGLASLFFHSVILAVSGVAQIIPDSTLGVGQNSEVISGASSDQIGGGSIRANNLFHSFREFNVSQGRSAYFINPSNIENIFARVTGSNASDIQGTLGVLGIANLFLMNPNGIIFGPNASLDVAGSFTATTANSFIFENSGIVSEFSATNPQAAPLLAINLPIGLQFSNTPGKIDVNQSFLQVAPGKTLALLGGGLTVRNGILSAPGGRIELGSVGGSEFVSLTQVSSDLKLGFGTVQNFQDIKLEGSVVISDSFDRSVASGDIQLSGKKIIVTNFSAVDTNHESNDKGGTITVNASDSVEISNQSALFTIASGPAGDISIDTKHLSVSNSSKIEASAISAKTGGNVNISASESVMVDGVSDISSGTFGGGSSGNVTVSTKRLTLANGGRLSTSVKGNSSGDGGSLVVEASEFIKVQGIGQFGSREIPSSLTAQTTGIGDGGILSIKTKHLDIRDGGRVSVAALEGSTGKAGVLDINATESIFVSGPESSVLSTTASSQDAGAVSIRTSDFKIRNGANVSASTTGSGAAGKIQIASDTFSISGPSSSLLSTTSSGGTGGEINIDTNTLHVFDRAIVDARTTGSGRGGNVLVNAKTANLSTGGQVLTTTSGPNSAGNITFNVSGQLTLTGSDSGLFASTEPNSQGSGGTIDVFAKQLNILDGAQVSTSTAGSGAAGLLKVKTTGSVTLSGANSGLLAITNSSGPGGSITVDTNTFNVFNNARVDAQTTGVGRGGSIVVNANTADISTGGQLVTTTEGANSAGDITFNVSDKITLSGPNSGLFASTKSDSLGSGGTISVFANQLNVFDGAQISTSTAGAGAAGQLNVKALESVTLSGSNSGLFASTAPNSLGSGGTVSVNTNQLTVQEGAQISTSTAGAGAAGLLKVNATNSVTLQGSNSGLSATTTGTGPGGDINVNTPTFTLSDNASVDARTTGEGRGGNLTFQTNTFNAHSGGQLVTTTEGTGSAGTITLNALDSVTLTGPGSGLFADTKSQGSGGSVSIFTNRFSIADGAVIDARTTAGGAGGSIVVNARDFRASNGGRLVTTTGGSQAAGNITLQALESLLLEGPGSGLFADTIAGSSGSGGSIFVSDPRMVQIRDQAGIGVDSQGAGPGGNIAVQTGNLNLENGAFISAETASGQGGNIGLTIDDTLSLAGGSRITATAGRDGGGGDGGNIDISAKFIITNAQGNNDITANAFSGQGGNITINAEGIFGFLIGGDPTPLSDITASSELGVAGTVVINRLDADPTQGLVELPGTVIDPSRLVAQICPGDAGIAGSNLGEFAVIGRGGVPTSPEAALNQDAVVTDWVSRNEKSTSLTRSPAQLGQHEAKAKALAQPQKQIVEAQGWVKLPNGTMVLTANPQYTLLPAAHINCLSGS